MCQYDTRSDWLTPAQGGMKIAHVGSTCRLSPMTIYQYLHTAVAIHPTRRCYITVFDIVSEHCQTVPDVTSI